MYQVGNSVTQRPDCIAVPTTNANNRSRELARMEAKDSLVGIQQTADAKAQHSTTNEIDTKPLEEAKDAMGD